MALGVSLISFSPISTMFSADMNSNFAQVNSATYLAGTSTFATNAAAMQTSSGVIGMTVDSSGAIHFPTKPAQDGSGNPFDYYAKFVGFNTGTFAHGYNSVNGNPTYFSPNVNSVNNSGAMGIDTITSTFVHINMPTAFSWFCACSHMF